MKVGDSVLFHMIPMHVCRSDGGDDVTRWRARMGLAATSKETACKCVLEASVSLPAKVLSVFLVEKGEPEALELAVDMPDDILALGYAPRQSCSLRALSDPPESGSWTPAP